ILAMVEASRRSAKAEEDRQAAFDAGIEQLDELTRSTNRYVASLDDLSKIPPAPADQWEEYASAVNLVAENQDKLKQKQRELASLEEMIQSNRESGDAALSALARNAEERAARLREEVQELERSTGDAAIAT